VNSSPVVVITGASQGIGDVVDAVLYLENSSFVTGEILHVDGGQSAGQ
jgi:NAD(P)-dependent dehydrogenase (short-subunit alcohol dehydrogenase family)